MNLCRNVGTVGSFVGPCRKQRVPNSNVPEIVTVVISTMTAVEAMQVANNTAMVEAIDRYSVGREV